MSESSGTQEAREANEQAPAPEKVVRLFGEPLAFEPVPEIVKRLEYLLGLAKDGSLRAIGYATVNVGADNVEAAGFGAFWVSGQIYNLTAAISVLNAYYSSTAAKWIMAGEDVREEGGPPKAAG